MDNHDDSENNAKISDSAYSTSCSNSQSRRSHSSKSTHSGSNSSGSSGYGGQPSTSCSSNNIGQQPKKEKEPKKKKQPPVEQQSKEPEVISECRPPEVEVVDFATPKEDTVSVIPASPPAQLAIDTVPESMEITASEKTFAEEQDGFSCVISMHDGVVMYTTASLTTTLGYPTEMWIGRSFIDFVHPRDRDRFASQITSGLAVPKIVNGIQETVQPPIDSTSTMVCRIRRYRGLHTGFAIKERIVAYMPFLLKLSFKNIRDEDGKVIYLVIKATSFFSAFQSPNEIVPKPVPFVMRHTADGILEYIDPESVPYMGYLPQDVTDQDALQLYHPEDLGYLRQVYESIVREGGVPRSKQYRLRAQNGDYILVETEWTSFINPWSRKLEFVSAKHFIIEGPTNPDVFQSPEPHKVLRLTDEERNKAQALRDCIVRIMNEVLTKPAEAVKQHMSKRCQDVASFMESLIEEPKADDELRLEIQDADHSYYERDSVMLGGISPHHEYNDSKSSTETPLSYTQLNYNENLQRYFGSHQPHSCPDYNAVDSDIGVTSHAPEMMPSAKCHSTMGQYSHNYDEMSSSYEPHDPFLLNTCMNQLIEYPTVRLTESLLNRHNAEMERELVKMHRETRTSSKGEREKASNEKRQKKKEHLARCNASFQPTDAGKSTDTTPHGVKRSLKHKDSDDNSHKHHCPSSRHPRRRYSNNSHSGPSRSLNTPPNVSWPTPPPMTNMNPFFVGLGISPQMSIMSPIGAMPGMFPMYYAPAAASHMPPSSNTGRHNMMPGQTPFQAPAMQCMMYSQAVNGAPFMYSTIGQHMPYPMQHAMNQSMQYSQSLNYLGLGNRNYEQACKQTAAMRSDPSCSSSWRDKKRHESQASCSKMNHGLCERQMSTHALDRSTEAVPETAMLTSDGKLKLDRLTNSGTDDTVDKTDGESSYSSFYSSFFKTESGSAEDSSDNRRSNKDPRSRSRFWDRHRRADDAMSYQSSPDPHSNYYDTSCVKNAARRKMDPPWMDQVCVTSELIYKYQIRARSKEEVLKADKIRMNSLVQPSLVNEQLGQLYLDLQLEGVAARLTLEEGITSSSSSGEETTKSTKTRRRKREYNRLVMIYEEDAPLPSPEQPDDLEI